MDWTPFAYPNPVNGIMSCQVCGWPTIVEYGYTCCLYCHRLLCATCQDTHPRQCEVSA